MNQPGTKEIGVSSTSDTCFKTPGSTDSNVAQLTERVFPRLRMRAEYQICLGFDALFSCLPTMEDGWCESDEESSAADTDSAKQENHGAGFLRFSTYEEVMADVETDSTEVASVEVLDMSAGGFCLEIDPGSSGYPKLGDVIGVREHSRTNWKLCVIRWSRPSPEGLQLGVELIAPVAFRTILRNRHTEAVLSPAVYIPGISLVGLPESVLIPMTRTVLNGDRVLVRCSGEDLAYSMDKTGLLTGSVKRMFISPAEGGEQGERVDVASSDIWATF
ncbi:hypothetical protein [Litoribacillus peritrichatus]|uniref:PilZ domain-containing protein n=1 Tax=Litoribacillus peritrichatus TaxID=718191 RepID=A0ABP7MTK0_9GAMM